jgi:glycosyltransferase involved in cell wall biosynthesis
VKVAVACLPGPREAAAIGAGVRREAALLSADGIELLAVAQRARLEAAAGRLPPMRLAVDAGAIALGFDRLHRAGARVLDARGTRAAVAARRALQLPRARDTRLVVSLDEGDLLAPRPLPATDQVSAALRRASLTIVASAGLEPLARAAGARRTVVVHPAVELPERMLAARRGPPTIVTVGELAPRKRAADVIRAVAVLGDRHPQLRCEIVGDGPERDALLGLARRLGVAERVELAGALPREQALARTRAATIYAMPSTEEAFGAYYLDAMAAGVPAIGCRGEPGPEEIAAAGAGLVLVPPGDIERLSQRIDELLSDLPRLRGEALRARETVVASFTWERRARALAAAYERALGD